MKANRPQLDKALKNPAAIRLFLFHGPDEAASRAFVKQLAAALGPEAERVDLAGSDLKADPARLADEAAAFSMFGGIRYILVDPAGEDCLSAVEALLEAGAAGNPVALVAPNLKPTSKLLKLALASPAALSFASYVPDARDWGRLTLELAREHGLDVRPDVARRVGELGAGNRAVIDQELAKFSLYLGAAPGTTMLLDDATIDAVGAGRDEGDAGRLVDCVFNGDSAGLGAELTRLRSVGSEGIAVLRPVLKRAMLLARLRAAVEEGGSVAGAVEGAGKSLFWKEKDAVARQLGRWRAATLQRSISRLQEAERQVKQSGSVGAAAADEELFAICRQASRMR